MRMRMRCHDPGEAREVPRINLLKREVLSFFFPSFPFLSFREDPHGTAGYGEGGTLGQYAWTNSVLVLVPSPPARAARDNVCVCVCAKGKLQTDTHTLYAHTQRTQGERKHKNKE